MLTTSHRRSATVRPSLSIRGQDAIEWEDLPSFADSLTQRLVMLGTRQHDGSAPVWVETVHAGLEATPPSEPFREALEGLQTREVHEPEVFRVFFGDQATTN